ncbi:MAG TPA: hypothetical protein VD860_17010 [Azospirillum sp.]|nr:hypothetical protein [Azospirillum sp.]
MRTSIFRIPLAIDGKVDFVRKTNPFGGGEDKTADTPPRSKAETAKDIKAKLLGVNKLRKGGNGR